MKIKNTSEVQGYSGKLVPTEKITVASHWNRNDIVEILIGDKNLFVSGQELKLAIENCMNTGR